MGVTGHITPFRFSSIDDLRLKSVLQKSQICINLKTTYDQKNGSFEDTIFKFNQKLINILKSNKLLEQYIFFSGLGVDKDNNSIRSNAVFKSEKEAFRNLKNSIIIRPGVIIGGGDVFLQRLLPIFKLSFFIPLFGSGKIRFQPVLIDDIS